MCPCVTHPLLTCGTKWTSLRVPQTRNVTLGVTGHVLVDNSIFESEDYLQAIGDISDDEAPPTNTSRYMGMGVGSGPALAKMPDKPDCSGMTPRSEKQAMHDYMLGRKAYQRDKRAATGLSDRRHVLPVVTVF